MPSCAAIAFGKRAKSTLAGVMALPNWRFMAQYMSFTTGFVGFSMGVSRMVVTSNRVDRSVGVLAGAPAIVDERKGGQERPERDAAGDPQGVAHATARARAREAAQVTPRSSSAGAYTPGASIDQCDAGSRPASVSVTCTSACRT